MQVDVKNMKKVRIVWADITGLSAGGHVQTDSYGTQII
jgi:hypothetical protein